MAEFEFTHNGEHYKIDADNEQSALEKLNKQITPTKFGDDVIMDRLRGKKTTIGDSGLNGLKALGGKLIEGLPLVGDFAPDNKISKDYETQHPIMSNMARIESAIGGNAALSGGLATVPALSRGLPWLASQTALGATVSGADKAIQEKSQGVDVNTSDILRSMGIGGASSLVGAGVSRVITPKPFMPPKTYTPEPPKGSSYEDILARSRWNNPENQKTQEQLASLINARRLENAKLAHAAQEPSKLATNAARVAGAVVGHHVDPTGGIGSRILHGIWDNRIVNNQIMADPTRAAIMQALLMSGAQGLNRLPTEAQQR